jgi:sterol desaturase/sphingolipid hydroxylase (fatty acid hydroxylase superfamily)
VTQVTDVLPAETLALWNSPAVLAAILLGGGVLYFARYVALSYGFYWLVYVKFKDSLTRYKIQEALPTTRQIKSEIRLGAQACGVFGITTAICHWLLFSGNSAVYLRVSDYGVGYLFFSFFVTLVVHDAYFYWTHRLCHEWKFLFRLCHRQHHAFPNPTPFADLALHPIDAAINATIVPVLFWLLPMHPITIAAFLTMITLGNIAGHIGYEFVPDRVRLSPTWRWCAFLKFHNYHHQRVACNYGFYTTLWDRAFGTYYDERRELKPSTEPNPTPLAKPA